jgi:outer membrane lipoprotein SlyB
LQESIDNPFNSVRFAMHIAHPQPILLAAAAMLLVAALGGSAIPSLLPVAGFKPDVAPSTQLAPAARCGRCGVIESIRAVGSHAEVRSVAWRITVRLDDGSVRALSQRAAPLFSVGDRVRFITSASGYGLERA